MNRGFGWVLGGHFFVTAYGGQQNVGGDNQ